MIWRDPERTDDADNGTVGSVGMKTVFESAEYGPMPLALAAYTLQLYVDPTVRNGTRIGEVVPGIDRSSPPSLDRQAARYSVIAEPPSEGGALNDTETSRDAEI